MQYLSLLLTLATACTAIDSLIFWDENCAGNYIGCLNINPSICCYLPSRPQGRSAHWNAVPPSWHLEGQFFRDTSGSEWYSGVEIKSKTASYCHVQNRPVESLAYIFWPLRRRDGLRSRDESQCTGSRKADTVGLVDGRRYSLVGMAEAVEKEFLGYVSVGGLPPGDRVDAFREFLI